MVQKLVVGLCSVAPLLMTNLYGQQASLQRQADSSYLLPLSLYLPHSALEVEGVASIPRSALPSLVETKFHYDARNNVYLLSTYYQGRPLSTPLAYTPEEFMLYMSRRQDAQAYRHFNQLSGREERQHKINSLFDAQSYRGKSSALERIFGEGGLQFNLGGSVDIRSGFRQNYIDNPSLSERARHNSYFDFGLDIEAQLRAKLGTKLSLELDYNTNNSFESNAKQMRLNYVGEEDDIIKLIEAGQVQFKPRNSLMDIGSRLYGVHSQMQFGPLSVDWLFSHQQTERRQIEVKGGTHSQNFELSAADYDEGRHFFLSDFFRSRYDEVLASRPYIQSGVQIRRIEVWVTNKQGRYEDTRHLLSFADLAEAQNIHNPSILPQVSSPQPHNRANSLYQDLQTKAIRNLSQASAGLSAYREAWDYDKLESARRLRPDEYVLNERLGYISLNTRLGADEVLAVAYEYSYDGQTYQVGEFSSDIAQEEQALVVKMLKGRQMQADAPYWHYMMRNVYALGGAGGLSISPEDFRLDVYYHSEEAGTYLPYVPAGQLAKKRWLEVLGLDKLNAQAEQSSDGRFDYIEGLTIYPVRGWVYLPSIAPLDATLRSAGLEEKYLYPELYKQSPIQAKRLAEKNKYQLRGTYKGSSAGLIQLGAMAVEPGSVRAKAGAMELTEGVDYIIDYTNSTLRITNERLLSSGQSIQVDIEGEGQNEQQRQSILGIDLNYKLSSTLQLGATALYLKELPLTNKLRFGEEAMQNFLWGAKLSWRSEGAWLQRLAQALPLKNLQGTSSITFNLEYAQLHPGSVRNSSSDGYTYIDDFEHSRSEIDLKSPLAWSLSSVPRSQMPPTSNDPLAAGYGRGHLSWFSIDPILTREHISQTPAYIKSNPKLLSSHYVREVELRELYPNREYDHSLLAYQPTLNLRFYPRERGMYNLNLSRLGADARFTDPEASWGGIMRRLDMSDFEAANVEYIEFWLMDPFLEEGDKEGGDLYFNIGDISEDVLPDGKKSFENGIPIQGDASAGLQSSPWGYVPRQASLGYAFDNNAGARAKQDIGLDGLSNAQEAVHPSYSAYRRDWLSRFAGLNQQGLTAQHSPHSDPAGDDFRHYMSELYNEEQTSILERYKYYNGMEGNSLEPSSGRNSHASNSQPDVEDINHDNNLNELERYYEYKVSLRPQDLRVGSNFVVASRTLDIRLRNGELSPVTWYQFRIPLSQYSSAVGGIQDMHSMRFMRMYLKGFREAVNLRFGSLRLLRGDWRHYTENLSGQNIPSQASLSLSAVNIEEHSDRQPINYVLPPGVSRAIEGGAANQLQANEQALSLQIKDLAPQEEQGIYRYVQYDLRRYKRLQLWVHAEQLADVTELAQDGDLEVFLRLGSDFKNNYYEYSSPLKLTAQGQYSNQSLQHRQAVWPLENMLDINLEELVALKRERNSQLAHSTISYLHQRYSRPSGTNPEQNISLMGNPSLSQVQTLLIGVRNRSKERRHAELWLNELRVGEAQHKRAYALNANLDLELGDFASVQIHGQSSTAGFGSLTQSLAERQEEDRHGISLSSTWQLGKLLPSKAKAKIPLHINYNIEEQSPQYSPRDTDMELGEALRSTQGKAKQELLDYSLRQSKSRNINLAGLNFGLRSPKPMPYDLGNWTLNFNHFTSKLNSPELRYQNQLNWQLGLNYDYAPQFQALRPFVSLKGKGSLARYLKQYGLKLWPNRLSLSTNLMRQYEEEQLRNQIEQSEGESLPPSFLHQFLWQRKLNIQWQLSPNLNLSLQTGTDARIEAPNVQVNRELNPDDYALWREAVERSIASMGTPQRYQQQASASYTLPTQGIKQVSWINANASYNSSYEWNRGAFLPNRGESLPNSISNQMNINLSTQLRLKNLYNLFPSLAKLERRILSSTTSSGSKSKQSAKQTRASFADRLLYALLAIKDVQFSLRHTQMTQLPGYMPHIGKALGQNSEGEHLLPGLGFTLGLNGESFIQEMAAQGRLSTDRGLALSGIFSRTKVVDFKATLQPIKDLSITLTANHTHTERQEHQYMQVGRPRLSGGDMQMTTIGLRGFFEGLGADKAYASSIFSQFLEHRQEVHTRLNEDIAPFASGAKLEANSPAVLLPAFRKTYIGQGNRHSPLIPAVSAILPNWTISYNLLGSMPRLSKLFRNLTLRQTYRGIYRINSYDSYAGWQAFENLPIGKVVDGLGYTEGRIGLGQDVASLSLSESFFPLIGADMSLKNGLSISQQWRRSRNITLSLASARFIETLSNEWNVSLSYRLSDLSSLWRAKPKYNRRKNTQEDSNTAKGLTLKADYSLGRSASLIRQIGEGHSQATAGNTHTRFSLSLDYELSRLLSLRAFYEQSIHRPLVSSTAYPMVERHYGIALRMNLGQLINGNER